MTKKNDEDELISGMLGNLYKKANKIEVDDLEKAIDYLNASAEIFESLNMIKNADKVINILSKIAKSKKEDKHSKNLSSQKMISNLEDHGTVFNLLNDDRSRSHFLNADDLEVSDEMDFEDEKD